MRGVVWVERFSGIIVRGDGIGAGGCLFWCVTTQKVLGSGLFDSGVKGIEYGVWGWDEKAHWAWSCLRADFKIGSQAGGSGGTSCRIELPLGMPKCNNTARKSTSDYRIFYARLLLKSCDCGNTSL